MRSLYSGLIGYWPLHTNSDNVACADVSNTDTSVTYVGGPIVGAADYAGGANYTTLTAPVGLPIGAAPHTVSFWMYLDTLAGGTEAIPYLWGAASTRQYRCMAFYGTGMNANVAWYSDDLVGSGLAATGVWTHWLNTYNGGVLNNTNVVLYKNGVDGGLTGGSGNSPNTPSSSIYLGRDMIRNSSPIDGRVAEFSIWDRVLTMGEIQWLYNLGLGRTFPFDGKPALLSPYVRRIGRRRRVGVSAA